MERACGARSITRVRARARGFRRSCRVDRIRKSPAFAGLPFAGRQWTLHPAFQLLPVELAVVVVVDGVELGGQRGVRLRFAAADAAVAVAVHRGEVDLVVAEIGRALD